MTRTLTITYDKSNEDTPVLCVAESDIFSMRIIVRKIFTGEKAEQLYNEITVDLELKGCWERRLNKW